MIGLTGLRSAAGCLYTSAEQSGVAERHRTDTKLQATVDCQHVSWGADGAAKPLHAATVHSSQYPVAVHLKLDSIAL